MEFCNADLQAVCKDYPEQVADLLAALDPDRPELAEVNAAAAANDLPAACA